MNKEVPSVDQRRANFLFLKHVRLYRYTVLNLRLSSTRYVPVTLVRYWKFFTVQDRVTVKLGTLPGFRPAAVSNIFVNRE
jgi:hypothetical protein